MSTTLSDYDKELSTHVVTPEEVKGIPKGKEAEFGAACDKLRAEVEAYENGPVNEHSSNETKEFLAMTHAENCDRVKQYQFDKQEELKRVRQGRVIYWLDFLQMLNKVIPARYTGATKQGMTALRVLVPTVNGGEWQFVCGVQAGYMHEYSTMYFDAHNLPTSEMYRGWRTVLLRLLQHGCVNDEQLDKVFGRASGPEAPRYLQQVYHIRNRG